MPQVSQLYLPDLDPPAHKRKGVSYDLFSGWFREQTS